MNTAIRYYNNLKELNDFLFYRVITHSEYLKRLKALTKELHSFENIDVVYDEVKPVKS